MFKWRLRPEGVGDPEGVAISYRVHLFHSLAPYKADGRGGLDLQGPGSGR